MEGWIKLHRKIVEWKFFKNSEVYHVFSTLVLLANHKEGYTKDGTKIMRGQLMTSNKSLSLITGIDESKIFRIVNKLKIEKQIEKRSSFQNTIISIVNYEDYQNDEELNEKRLQSDCKATEERVKTNKNAKNVKNEKNNIIAIDQTKFIEVNPEILRELWDTTVAGNGRLSVCRGLSGQDCREFSLTVSFEQFHKKETWVEIFSNVTKSEFLSGKRGSFTATLGWLLNHENALKVLNGLYNGGSSDSIDEYLKTIKLEA
jgi:hypothetical protein